MRADPRDPVIGRLLERRYEVGARIARGGMASVYEGFDLRLERTIAIKVMHPHLGDDPQFRERFIQEARAAARLTHPNVVNTFDQGEDDGFAWLVMELVPSITMRDLLTERGRVTPDQALDVLEAVLAGLAAAHRAGIVHRDLKPENILLAHDGRIKIGDFGLARAATANTATGKALLGTIAYLSPELVTRGYADMRSDLYAVGIMLFEMLTGKQPFTGDEPMQIAFQHANESVPLPSSAAPGVPESLDALVHWSTQRDPNLRPADAGEMLAEVRAIRERGLGRAATRVIPTASEDERTTSIVEVPRPKKRPQPAPAAQIVQDTGDGAIATALARRATIRRRRGVLWLAFALIGALIAASVGWWFNLGPGGSRVVPAVAGLSEVDARAALDAAGITVAGTASEPNYDTPSGDALRTDPDVGASLAAGGSVQLILSSGRRSLPVPKVQGVSVDEARSLVEDAGFTVADDPPQEVFDSRVEQGLVTAGFAPDGTNLAEVDSLEERSPISLRVSLGAVPVQAGQAADEAKAALEDVGLVADFSATENSRDVPEGALISVNVPTDRSIGRGETISGVVSLGPRMLDVPNVVGRPITEAVETIRQAGFEPDLTTNVPDFLQTTLQIVSQEPRDGKAREGSSIALDATY